MNIKLTRRDLIKKTNLLKPLDKNVPIAIYGSGIFAQDLKDALDESGYDFRFFVNKDNFLKKLKISNSLKISEKIFLNYKEKIQLVIGVHNREVPISKLIKKFKKNIHIDIFYPQDIFHLVEEKMGWRYWLSSKDYLLKRENFIKFSKALSLLSDNLSRERLCSIYKYRLGLMNIYSNFMDKEKQYFNKISIPKRKNIIYCDIGAFDGDTISSALKNLFLREIYAFEPVSESFKSLIKKFKTENIRYNFLPLGVSNQYKKTSFSNSDLSSESARIEETGNDFINTISLDESFNIDFNFIKIDVEGFEKDVLLGAKKTIMRAKPVIAMSLYHNPYDLWELPILIKKILPEYKLYVRQHYFNTFDCVLYCIPR